VAVTSDPELTDWRLRQLRAGRIVRIKVILLKICETLFFYFCQSNFRAVFGKLHFLIKWKGSSRKQSARWQHVTWLKDSVFGKINYGGLKHNTTWGW
jgi:hypothetical protein